MQPDPPAIQRLSTPLCLDGRMLNVAGTGVSTYAATLQQVQARLASHHGLLVATATPLPVLLGALDRRPRRSTINVSGTDEHFQIFAADVFRRAHVHFSLYGQLLKVKPPFPNGIMHWTYPVPITMDGWHNVYTVHDAIPISHPELSPVDGTRLRHTLTAIAQTKACIATVSNASLAELDRLAIFKPGQIVNTGVAIVPNPADIPATDAILRRLGLEPGSYFLTVGSVELRKNIPRLLDAYAMTNRSIPLVIAGPPVAHGAAIEARIQQSDNVLRLAFQDRDTLDALMAGARALLFPSLAEGFGLPIIEAMARGTAVLTGTIPATVEVAGGAGLLVDPTDTRALAQAINRLVTDGSLIERLRNQGLERAQAYRFDEFLDRISALYCSLLDAATPVPPRQEDYDLLRRH